MNIWWRHGIETEQRAKSPSGIEIRRKVRRYMVEREDDTNCALFSVLECNAMENEYIE